MLERLPLLPVPLHRSFTFVTCVCAALLVACGAAPDGGHAPNSPTPYNVVLVTLDGVRWQDVFAGADSLLADAPQPLMPMLLSRESHRAALYGNVERGSSMTVANAANASLPGYMSLFAESEQGCLTNGCGRISVPTMVDRMRDELSFEATDIIVDATWPQVRLAISARDEVATVHAGGPVEVSQQQSLDVQMPALQTSLEQDRPTVHLAFEHLKQQPRFLYLSLLDSDRFGHQDRYQALMGALRTYDQVISELLSRLREMGEYGQNTALVVTTDHGRGVWDQWSQHGPHVPASADVWAMVLLPPAAKELALVAPDARLFTHDDVRYTIETLLGLGTANRSGPSTGFVAVPRSP